MVKGRYIYCVLEGDVSHTIEKIGISNSDVYAINHNGISVLVSTVPFEEIQPNVVNIAAHQRVVEASRDMGATLPVRFGVIFKTEEGIRKFLSQKTKEYKSKLTMFRDADEIGVKIVLDSEGLKRIEELVQNESETVNKMKKEISSASEGTAYFLKMKMKEMAKHETLKRIEKLTSNIHTELSKSARDSTLLKIENPQIILNSAYLVNRNNYDTFNAALGNIKKKYESAGLTFHTSGPWAPYSFC